MHTRVEYVTQGPARPNGPPATPRNTLDPSARSRITRRVPQNKTQVVPLPESAHYGCEREVSPSPAATTAAATPDRVAGSPRFLAITWPTFQAVGLQRTRGASPASCSHVGRNRESKFRLCTRSGRIRYRGTAYAKRRENRTNPRRKGKPRSRESVVELRR